jgi:NAD(P)-dependent dehydrogenase (short-subunit alcohol dehydrogenase family)
VLDAVVVTGAASGIGRSVSELLVADGQNVIGLDRREPDVAGVQPLVCDLTDSESIDRVIGGRPEKLGGLVNCAGLPGTHTPEGVLRVNLLAPRRLSQGLVERIVPSGVVVNVASVAAARSACSDEDVALVLSLTDTAGLEWLGSAGLDGPATYDFSKKALVRLTLVHCASWLARRVRCVSVSPGPTVTPILGDFEETMGRERIQSSAEIVGGHADPGDVAAIIVFLLGRSARWINGIDIRVDGGLLGARMAPAIPAR